MEDEASHQKLKATLREAAINSTLDHPNVVSTFSYNIQPLNGSQVKGRYEEAGTDKQTVSF